MSLIHDALKKAQQEQRSELGSGVTSMEESHEMVKKGVPKRTIVLAVILITSLIIFAYLRFKPKPDESSASAPVPKTADSAEDKKCQASQDN